MAEVQRVRLKKIYLGRIALFGLAYGLILGIIFGVISMILAFTTFKGSTILGITLGNNIIFGASITIAFIVLIGAIISSTLSFIISAAIYNLISRFKLMIDVDFMEYEEKPKEKVQDQRDVS